MKKFSLRLLAIFLAVAMLAANFVTAATALDSLPVYAQQNAADERETVTITDAKIVAEYYGFVSEGEKAVLNCNAIVGDTHVIPVPADSDELVSVDAEAQTVAATTFTKDGYTWTPVRAYLVYQDAIGSDIRIPVTLDENGNGSFNTKLESYSIEVDYEVKVDIDVTKQSLLVNAPAALVDGLANLENVAKTEGGLTLIANETVFAALVMMTERIPFYASYFEFFGEGTEGYNAIKSLEANRTANGGTFALLNEIAEYNASANKVEFLLKNGADVKAACSIADAIAVLADETKGLPSQKSMLDMALRMNVITQSDYDNMETLTGVFTDLAVAFAEVKEEKWAVLDNSPVKANADANELQALELALNAAKSNVQYHNDVELVESLVAATTTVKAGVAQSRVNVVVNAQVISATSINDNTLSTIAGKSANFLIADGATEDEIFDKIEAIGICADALAYWSENAAVYNVDSEFYTAEYAVAEVDGVIEVTVTYVPVTFEIKSDFAEDVSVYCGYRYCLESHSDSEKSYDYKVNGAAKYEGEIITINEDINVTRTEGNALSGSAINAIIANSSVGNSLSAAAKDILNVNGFKVSGNEDLFGTLKYRLPTIATLEATAVENGYKVTAPGVVSGLLSGASWTAVSVDLLDENGAILASYELEDGSVEFTFDGAFANARINFELVVDVDADDVHTVANLPYILTNEAEDQLAILDRMADGSLYSSLGTISAENINLIVTVVNASKMSQSAKDAVALLKTDCVDAAGNILLYSYLTAYKAAKTNGASEGLKYYYTANNAKNIKNQLEILSGVFNALCPADTSNEDRKIFTDLLSSNGLSSYVEKLDSIRESIDSCKSIAAVNEYIDAAGSSLGILTAAICKGIGKTEAYEGDGKVVLSNSVLCAAPDKTTVKIVINVVKGDGTVASYTDTLTLKKGAVVADLLVEKFNALDATIAINKNYYSVAGLDAIPQGNVVIDDITSNVVVTYTPYTYAVNVPGAATQSFSYDADWTITLPASANSDIKLVYTVAGATVEVVGEDVRYTFTNLNAFGADRTLTVEVEEVDLAAEKFINFINMLNEAVGEVGGRFIPVEDEDGNIVIVFRVSSSISSAMDTGVIANLPMALAMYDEITLGGNTFWDGSAVHLQAMTKMVSNSGFSFDRFCQIIRENGTVVNDADLSALEPMIDAQGNMGGRLMDSTITIDGKTMGFYVTLSDTTSAELLSKMRSAVSTVKNYFNIVCDDGKFQFIITAPDSVYPYYLAQMLVAGKVDITDISKLNLRESIRYEWGLIKGIITDDRFSTETIENTFAVLGKDVSLEALEGVYNNFKKVDHYLNSNIDVVVDDEMASDSYSGTFLINLNSVFNKVAERFALDDTMMGLIYEASPDAERYEIDFSVELTNIVDKDYDAIVFDINGDGLTKKFYCTNDLADVLNNLGNYGIVVITSDVTLSKDVYIPANAVIDLNGYTITGNISAGGTVRFVDSRFGTEEAGMVDGQLGRGQFIITGGKFTDDISQYLRTGYYVNEDGYVRNKIYSIEKIGNDVEIALSAAYINNVEIVDFQSLILDVAIDAAMSSFSAASIAIDGKDIYSFACEDITAILGGGATNTVNSIIDIFNPEGFSAVLNDVIGKLTDFKGLASAIKNDEAIVDYALTVKNWDIVPYIADGNYITFDAVPSNAETGRFTVVIAGSEEEKAALASLCDDLSVIEVNTFEINLGDINYNGGFSVDLDGAVDVHINLAKNRAYAALVCAAAAYSTNNTAKKQAYVKALEEYLSGESSSVIMAALEGMTTKEMIAAFKAIDNVSCEKLLTSIGINVDNQTTEVVRLFGAYDQIVSIGSKVLTRLDVVGNDATLAGHKVSGSFATYNLQTELVGRIDVSLTITTVAKFGEIKVEDFGIADSVTKETVNFFKNDIELANGLVGVALDISSNGMKVRDFIALFNLDIVGALRTNIEVIDKNGALKSYDDLVCTGDTLIVTAFDGLVEYIVMERVVAIVGDTDGDGVTDSKDAYAIAMLEAGVAEMDEVAMVAADINGNGVLDIGDAAKICYKAAADWADYIA